MTDVVELGDKKSYLDRTLRNNLDDMQEDVRKDDDIVIVIDGKERIGKSLLGMVVGWYLSGGKLQLKDICLSPEEFKERIRLSQQYDVIIFDECYLGLAAADWASTYNRLIKRMLVTCGQRNLMIILILPSVFDLDKYVALHRADCLLHCFKFKGLRGHFSFYNNRRLQKLYIYGKKIYSYWQPKPNFARKFVNFYPVNEAEYRKKKSDSLNELLSEIGDESASKKTEMLYKAINFIYKHTDIDNKTIAKALECSIRTLERARKWDSDQRHRHTTPL